MDNSKNVREVLGQHILVDGMQIIMDLQHSHGCWIVDQRDGAEYLDLYTMYASQAIGYNHPGMLEISGILARAAIQKPTCSDTYTEEMARFMEIFEREAIPDYLPHAFFIWKIGKLSNRETGTHFGLTYSAVSRRVKIISDRISNEEDLKTKYNMIKLLINGLLLKAPQS